MFGCLKPWKAVKEVLDFTDEGESIFDRPLRGKKPYVEATEKRIYAGLVKFVAKGDDSFIKKYYSGKPEGKVVSTDGPAGTITTIDSQAIVRAKFMVKYLSNCPKKGYSQPVDINNPSPTVTTQNRLALVQPEFNVRDRMSVVWLDKQYGSGHHNIQSVEKPSGTITCNDKHQIASAEFLFNHNFENHGSSVDHPAPTLLASRRHFYLLNPQLNNLEEQILKLSSGLESKLPSIIEIEKDSGVVIVVHPEDSPTMIKIKLFMAQFGITDIKMRMLKVPELLRIQGFPKDYKMIGSQTDHKKFIGNSVVPDVVKEWSLALGMKLKELNMSLAA